MVRLTVEQNRIGQILQAGSLLLTDSTTSEDAARQIEAQMSLLNTHWEDLRIHAMDRQTRYRWQFCVLHGLVSSNKLPNFTSLYLNTVGCPYLRTFVRNAGRGQLSSE